MRRSAQAALPLRKLGSAHRLLTTDLLFFTRIMLIGYVFTRGWYLHQTLFVFKLVVGKDTNNGESVFLC